MEFKCSLAGFYITFVLFHLFSFSSKCGFFGYAYLPIAFDKMHTMQDHTRDQYKDSEIFVVCHGMAINLMSNKFKFLYLSPFFQMSRSTYCNRQTLCYFNLTMNNNNVLGLYSNGRLNAFSHLALWHKICIWHFISFNWMSKMLMHHRHYYHSLVLSVLNKEPSSK